MSPFRPLNPVLVLSLVALGFSSPALAQIDFEPKQVAKGKASEIQITLDDPSIVQSITLQPDYPSVVDHIDLNNPAAGLKISRDKGDLRLLDSDGQLLADFPNTDTAEHGRLRYQVDGKAGLSIMKRRGWVSDKEIGHYRTSEPAVDITLADDLALIATGPGGLTVLDVSAPVKPQWMGSHQKLGNAIKVSAEDGYVAVLNDANVVYLIDLKNPKEPTSVGAVRSNQLLRDLYLNGDKVYALGDKEIEVIDFTARAPQISNEDLDFGQGVNLGGERRVYIDNQIAYVADWFSGIHLYDISRPHQPELLSSFHTPGSPKGMMVRDGIAYVPDDDHGLSIIDVSDPLHPKHISTLQTDGLGYTPRLVGNLLYLASHRGGFQIIDVSDVKNPKQLSHFDTEGKAWSMEVHGNIAYVADDDQGLLTFDVSDPTNPKPIGQYFTGGAAEEVMVRDNIAFVAYYDDGLHILDVSDPTNMKPISKLMLPGNSRGLDLVGNTLYVAGWLSGVHTVDVSDIKNPKLLGSYDTRGAAWGLKVKGNDLFVMDWWGGVTVVDISDPTQLKAVGGYHNRGRVHSIAGRDNYVYVAQGSNGVQVFDIKNALHPTWTTGTSLPGQARDIALQGDRAYVAAGDGGLAVVDITTPFDVHWLNSAPSRGELEQLVVDGDYLFARDNHDGLVMYDISGDTPRRAATLAGKVNDLWLSEGRLYLAGDDGLKVIERDSGRLKVVLETNDGAIDQLAVAQRQLYLARGKRIQIFSLAATPELIGETTLSAAVTDLEPDEQAILVSTEDGLVDLAANGTINASYPMISTISDISLHRGTVYISGEENITAIQPLAPLSVPVDGQSQVTLALPDDLKIGDYQLCASLKDGSQQPIATPLKVAMPKFSKPKLTMEEFKRLMEQKRNSDIFVKPATDTPETPAAK